MPKNISRQELVRKFQRLGFDGPHAGGRHSYMRKGRLKVRIPNRHRGDISRHLVAEILRQAGISAEEWEET